MSKLNRKTRFFNKAINLIKHHGSVVIYFKDREGYMRKRRLTSTCRCYVKHLGAMSGVWSRDWVTSCFMLPEYGRGESVSQVIRTMNRHDVAEYIVPMMIEWGKGRNMKRLEYGKI